MDKRKITIVVMSFFSIGLLCFIWFVLSQYCTFCQIRDIHIIGETQNISDEVLEKVKKQFLYKNYFSLDLSSVLSHVLSISRVRTATVERCWPFCVSVQIQQHSPIAFWGKDRLMSDHGDVFDGYVDRRMPELIGPLGTERDVFYHYQIFQKGFQKIGLSIERLYLSERHSWTIETTDFLKIILGRDISSYSIQDRFAYFLAAHEQLCNHLMKNHKGTASTIDLRYLKGMAIKTVKSQSDRLKCSVGMSHKRKKGAVDHVSDLG